MSSSRFSLRLDPDLKAWLEREAERQDRSAAWIATQAIENLRASTEAKRQMAKDAVAKADEGMFVSQGAVHRWMESWDTPGEVPAPKPAISLKRR
ncbi:ribbon-helix-helix protein, CopG family [Oleomonas cavernae]|uniref:Ribbon-helix-helix protein, CopG family n=1 Tax=Oleomonas cavernae TaxID=2320859 RepID=A0A418WJ03_9PROT|nr:ribbon-helix-helix protein, CopG family [Oleomonas cavernae]RJF89984.1 ribbon-helix-helix protein, CopG family [Oleomonas cavernae]